MHITRKISEDLLWVGASDRRLSLFEGVFSVPKGVSYNSYLLLDDKTVLFDTVDRAVGSQLFENLEYALNGRTLDYVVIQHMEPDHSATLLDLMLRYPDVKIICSAMALKMINNFFTIDTSDQFQVAAEGDTLDTGKHKLTFLMAPMVHWPEVMVTYDETTGALFSADAFGTFGALNGALWADEVDFDKDYMDEARRYYCNIVGKYGPQVQSLLKKIAALDVKMICPLHGFVWRKDLDKYIDKYQAWSSYTPEEKAVMIAYASVYGNTENAAEALSVKLREKNIKTVMFDVSVDPISEIVAASFRYSHLVFASSTYNSGIFIKMEDLLRDLSAHSIQNRTVTLIENGSWAPTSGKLMKKIIEDCPKMTIIGDTLSIKSSLKADQEKDLDALADEIAFTI
ncbi:MAG: FprA family A-type flavoprotein [Clostridiales bacterium]|nr:FprA family A-type flavoprotein [Clostridiales bacterium]